MNVKTHLQWMVELYFVRTTTMTQLNKKLARKLRRQLDKQIRQGEKELARVEKEIEQVKTVRTNARIAENLINAATRFDGHDRTLMDDLIKYSKD
jgi:predicted ribosome quality control (RQC) complex YloA/Tae2 family protein